VSAISPLVEIAPSPVRASTSALKSGGNGMAWLKLGWLMLVVLGWATVATQVFRRRGWR
jgi:hypothetical protein